MFLDYNFRNYNYRLFLYVLLLNITGVLIIRSASNQDISMVLKQIVGILVGLTAVIILSLVDYHKVVSVAPLIYGTSLAFLLAVLVFGGSTLENMRRFRLWRITSWCLRDRHVRRSLSTKRVWWAMCPI